MISFYSPSDLPLTKRLTYPLFTSERRWEKLLPCSAEEWQGGASGGKKTWKFSYEVVVSLIYSFAVFGLALSSSGMSLKATICWSICLPVSFLSATSLLSMMRPGLPSAHPLCCYPNALWPIGCRICGGARGCARHVSDSSQREENRNWQLSSWIHLVQAHMEAANEPGAAAF